MDTATVPPSPPSSPGPSTVPGPPTRPPVSHRARTAWKAAASIATVVVLIWGVTTVVGQVAHEERTEVTTYDPAGLNTLDVRIDGGSLTVVGTDRDEITVTARISDGLRATSVTRRVEGDRLVLRGGCSAFFSTFCDVSYTVEMPSRMAVRARLDQDGTRLTGVEGDIDVHTDNGSVTITGSGPGPLLISSDNGRVTAVDLRSTEVDARSDNGDVTLAFRRSPRSVRATSDNGSVAVAVPDDGTSYAVSTGTDHGSSSVAVRTDPDAAATIAARSGHGDVQVTYTAD